MSELKPLTDRLSERAAFERDKGYQHVAALLEEAATALRRSTPAPEAAPTAPVAGTDGLEYTSTRERIGKTVRKLMAERGGKRVEAQGEPASVAETAEFLKCLDAYAKEPWMPTVGGKPFAIEAHRHFSAMRKDIERLTAERRVAVEFKDATVRQYNEVFTRAEAAERSLAELQKRVEMLTQIAYAADGLLTAQSAVHPTMSREDAERAAYQKLRTALGPWHMTQRASMPSTQMSAAAATEGGKVKP